MSFELSTKRMAQPIPKFWEQERKFIPNFWGANAMLLFWGMIANGNAIRNVGIQQRFVQIFHKQTTLQTLEEVVEVV